MVVNAGRMNANRRNSCRPRDGQQHCRHRSEIWKSCPNANELHRSLNRREPEDKRDQTKKAGKLSQKEALDIALTRKRIATAQANITQHLKMAGLHDVLHDMNNIMAEQRRSRNGS